MAFPEAPQGLLCNSMPSVKDDGELFRAQMQIISSSLRRSFDEIKDRTPFINNLLRMLSEVPPEFEDGKSQKIRFVLLDILSKLPKNQHFRPYVRKLLQVATDILPNDNEVNAILCIETIKNSFQALVDESSLEVDNIAAARQCLQFAVKIYKSYPEVLRNSFSKQPDPLSSTASSSSSSSSSSSPRQLTPSLQSLKVIAECPQMIARAWTLCPRLLEFSHPIFPLLFKSLTLKLPRRNASKTHPNVYINFIHSQIQTLTVLTWKDIFLMLPKLQQDFVALSVGQLLVMCPSDSSDDREELLRFATDIRLPDYRKAVLKGMESALAEKALAVKKSSQKKRLLLPTSPNPNPNPDDMVDIAPDERITLSELSQSAQIKLSHGENHVALSEKLKKARQKRKRSENGHSPRELNGFGNGFSSDHQLGFVDERKDVDGCVEEGQLLLETARKKQKMEFQANLGDFDSPQDFKMRDDDGMCELQQAVEEFQMDCSEK